VVQSEVRSESIILSESETVVPRGHRKVVWFVDDDERWRPVATHPSADVEEEEPAAATVWARRVLLRLPLGTNLMRVDSRPAEHPPRDVLEYLQRETRLAERQVLRTYYSVGWGGTLKSVE
jgi:hypothetical protein